MPTVLPVRPSRTRVPLWITLVFVVLFNLGVGIGSLMGLGTWVAEVTKAHQLDVQLCFMALHATSIAIGLAVAFKQAMKEHDAYCDLLNAIAAERPEIKQLNDDEFHARFLRAARRADSHVYIMNLSDVATYFQSTTSRRDYFKDFLKTVRRDTGVRFRRLHRLTTLNIDWQREMIEKLKGRSNISFALLNDSGDEQMPLALSVQLVDTKMCWIVAIDGHERTGQYRDIEIVDPAFNSMIERYYNRLWGRSVVVLENGQLTSEGRSFLETGDL